MELPNTVLEVTLRVGSETKTYVQTLPITVEDVAAKNISAEIVEQSVQFAKDSVREIFNGILDIPEGTEEYTVTEEGK